LGQQEYLSVLIDDPIFLAPVQCRLVKAVAEQSCRLVWERQRKPA